MEFDSVIVKDSPGLCRCCLAEGCYKELGAPYFCGGHTEVYGDMLMECFDICISQQTDGPNGPNRHICEVCIGRLRDATEFKRQVLESEKTFIDMVARKDFKGKMMVGKKEMKKEPGTDVDPDVNMIDTADVFDDDTDEEPLSLKRRAPRASGAAPRRRGVKTERKKARKNDESEEELLSLKSGDEGVDAAPLATPRRASEVKTEKRKRIKKKTEDAASSNTSKSFYMMKRRKNLQIIFDSSTIIPFKWRANYICFYCGIRIVDYKELRRHTETHGSVADCDLKSIKGYGDMNIKIDISNITCKLCNVLFRSFNELTEHLCSAHQVKYEVMDVVIEQYRLLDLGCHLCPDSFSYFGHLVSHMNHAHPNKTLICNQCNHRFSKRSELYRHIKNCHKVGGYQCDMCPHKFNTLSILKKHQSNAHRCEVCHLQLPSAAQKQKHCQLEHPESYALQCRDCNKIFKKKLGLRVHMKKCNAADTDRKQKLTVKRHKLDKVKDDIINVIILSTSIPFNFTNNKFNCFYCADDFIDSDSLREHTLLSHANCDANYIKKNCKTIGNVCVKLDTSYVACKLCYESLRDLDALIEHLAQKHDTQIEPIVKTCLQPYRLIKDNMGCPYCPAVFQFFNLLMHHVSVTHSNNNVVCVYCGLTFGNENQLRAHTRTHHSDGQLKCGTCGAVCDSRSRLANHMATAHGVKAVKCTTCGERFSSQYLRQKHMMDVHKFGHKCNYCGKEFVRHSFMKIHVRRTHLKEKRVACPVCDMKFFNGVQLKHHLVKHGGKKNFQCDECGESFMWRKGLVRHIGRHSKNPFSFPAVPKTNNAQAQAIAYNKQANTAQVPYTPQMPKSNSVVQGPYNPLPIGFPFRF
ncbi:zinc finger protein 569 isoform X1 [Plutella xylostella]|uniref:zinc finger protein 569 isoform X1 n=1 Tax=Plutella xylostella TaxID=51655 RepID=UPI002032A742|nr:zinc finger protein 569 isoform X1 [Plutella xylostella]